MLKTKLARLILGTAIVVLGLPVLVHAQNYPERAIRFILPFAPGQGTDVATRLVMTEVSKKFGQPIIIENRPGASGMIAIQAVQKAAPDGYTVLGFSSSFLANSALRKEPLPYDLKRDFVPVIRTVNSAVVLVVHPSVPVKSLKDVLEMARRDVQGLNYASGGNTTTMHLAGEMLRARSGVLLTHVPYKGDPAALNDLLGGQIKFGFSGFAAALPHIRAGKLRPIAVTTPTRIEAMPDVPTIAESGFPGYDLVGWLGYMVPAGTPPAIVQKLYLTIRQSIEEREIKDRMANLGMLVAHNQSPSEFKLYVETSEMQISEVIKSAGIKAD